MASTDTDASAALAKLEYGRFIADAPKRTMTE